MNTLLSTSKLTVSIGGVRVCDALDLVIDPGQSWALLGRNGSGKTTLLHHLCGLRRGHTGGIRLLGDDIDALPPRQRARRVSALLQHSERGFGRRVIDTVLSARHPYQPMLAWDTGPDLALATRQLERLGLTDFAQRSLQRLSGGELRRVEIARLLTQDCPLSLLDEPMNHLDPGHQSRVLHVLGRQCVTDDRAMLLVLHDLNLAYHSCDHWLLLAGNGEWLAGTREQMADEQTLTGVFGHPIRRIDSPAGPVFLPAL
ncbi:MAG: ABC transporter ATP-binding protein [Gammaproteobacteria bacterium]|nr:ABC transporter ATP-binding protein [Gammaproteobacteria bacterium]